MNCPRCEMVLLTERERDGILVDTCAACRGVWLDRGELEKLVTRAIRNVETSERGRDDTPPRGQRYADEGDGDRREPRRKRSWLEDLFD